MKPKTKEQKKLLEVMQLFPEPTEKQIEYAKKHCFNDLMIESRGRVVCTHCGHSWKPKDAGKLEAISCPHCGHIAKIQHNKAAYKENEYFVISRKVGEYQAFQFFLMKKYAKANTLHHWHGEVGTMFIDMSGNRTFFSLSRFAMSWIMDAWSFDSEIELRKSDVLDRLGVGAIITTSIHPTLKRNGWNGKLFHNDCTHTPRHLLTDPQFESLWKIGQYGICEAKMRWGWYRSDGVTEDERNRIIRLCNRYGKIYKTSEEWGDLMDYVSDLKFLNRDFGNPKILFPENFQEEKMRINNKRHEKERAIAREAAARRAIEEAERDKKKKEWVRTYQRRFKDMCINSDGFTIKALLTRDDFDEEWKAMNHCIRSYYGKIDTLLISISVGDKKTETAEIDLKNYEVKQCRGANNQPSAHHDQIIQLLAAQMKVFRAYNERKFVKKSKTEKVDTPATTTPNLPAVIYKMAC